MKRYVVSGTLTLDVRTVIDAADESRAGEEAVFELLATCARALRRPTDMLVQGVSMHAVEVPRSAFDPRAFAEPERRNP